MAPLVVSINRGVLLVGPSCGCPCNKSLLLGVYIWAPDFRKLPYTTTLT